MDPALPCRLRDQCPRCKCSLDCAVFIGLTRDERLVMVCEQCYAELQDAGEPACLRPAALEGLTRTTAPTAASQTLGQPKPRLSPSALG
jgi:hypothetical protein